MTLSSTEADLISLSEAVKDVMFVLNICRSISTNVKVPVTVCVDNIGIIFISNNVGTTSGTRYVGISNKFVKEYQENRKIKIIFVRSEENDSDIINKTLGSLLHSKHASKLTVKKIGIKYTGGRLVGTGKKLCFGISYWYDGLYTFE